MAAFFVLYFFLYLDPPLNQKLMSDNALEEYKAYYITRAERFANNPNYKHSYEAEKNLSEAMQNCSILEEFKEKVGNLPEKCAIALIKDEHLVEKAFFDKHEEVVRVKAADRILEKAESCESAMDLVTLVTEVTNEVSILISMDESDREFHHRWGLMDEIEIYENAEVPDGYKKEFQETVAGIKESIVTAVTDLEANNASWQSDWKHKPDVVMEHRHRRLLPYSDEHIREQLSKYKSIVIR